MLCYVLLCFAMLLCSAMCLICFASYVFLSLYYVLLCFCYALLCMFCYSPFAAPPTVAVPLLTLHDDSKDVAVDDIAKLGGLLEKHSKT